jgi:predicted RNA-binding Zn-ribbon protein involved in translation (DUF1610 family)
MKCNKCNTAFTPPKEYTMSYWCPKCGTICHSKDVTFRGLDTVRS